MSNYSYSVISLLLLWIVETSLMRQLGRRAGGESIHIKFLSPPQQRRLGAGEALLIDAATAAGEKSQKSLVDASQSSL